MTVDLYSKRQKALRGEVPGVYTYGPLPRVLRVQIIYIWYNALGNEQDYRSYAIGEYVQAAYKSIVDDFCKERGLLHLPGARTLQRMYMEELSNYFIQVNDVEEQIDIIELSFRFIDTKIRNNFLRRNDSDKQADDAINELNERFKEHGVGFKFVEGQIIKVDSELIHSEVVEPVLKLFNERGYKGSQQEFLNAHDHYRHGRHKEALNECLKSFESTMKAICDKREWERGDNATANELIKVCFDNNLVPEYLQQHYNSLRSTLESGIPTIRNREAAHGQGVTPTEVPEHLVAYMLNMTASALLFLMTAEKNLG